jgi:hypothetical protein
MEDIERWIKKARDMDYEFIISAHDTFDGIDYPVYCKAEEDVKMKYPYYDGKEMQKVNGIIKVPRKKAAIENLSIYDF